MQFDKASDYWPFTECQGYTLDKHWLEKASISFIGRDRFEFIGFEISATETILQDNHGQS